MHLYFHCSSIKYHKEQKVAHNCGCLTAVRFWTPENTKTMDLAVLPECRITEPQWWTVELERLYCIVIDNAQVVKKYVLNIRENNLRNIQKKHALITKNA